MIFRRPYAFLIKYFKIINIVLTLLSVFLAYKTFSIVGFFREYILNNYSGNYYQGFSSTYINSFVYLAIFLILIGLAFIISLFMYKKKPSSFYMASAIFYIFLLIYLLFIKNTMVGMEKELLATDLSRAYRDITLIIFFIQFAFIGYFFTRGIGINARKLNFEKDLKDLQIEAADNEEVEITFKGDNVKLKRNFNRFIREFNYYIKENKFIVVIIAVVLIFVLSIVFYRKLPEVIDHNYNQGTVFSSNNLNYVFEDSIITNLDYNGNIIEKDAYYVVVRLKIENPINEKVNLDYNEFRLEIGNNYYYPVVDKGIYFMDYARNYYANEIKANSNGTYSLVYKIKPDEVKKRYKIKMTNGTMFSKELNIGKFNYINLTPVVIEEVMTANEYKAGEKINLSNTYLGDSWIKFENPKVKDRHVYSYEICLKENKCSKYKDIVSVDYVKGNSTLIVADCDFKIDKSTPFSENATSVNAFIQSFMKVKYIDENGKMQTVKAKDVTPTKMKGQIAMEVAKEVKDSKEVYLSIIIRNKEYLVRIV